MKTTIENMTRATANENTQAIAELHKAGATVVGIASLFMGGWAIACMTAGVIISGGPVALATEYIKAIAG
ncbi:MAG: hypothetical protein ABIJ50_04320 [Pseudomonadota bacterium]